MFYLEFIYTSCATYSPYLFFRSLAYSTSYALGLVDHSICYARGLLRPPSMFTFPTTLRDLTTKLYTVLDDCAGQQACLCSQPCSRTRRPIPTPCSQSVPTIEHIYVPNRAWGLVDDSLHRARRLLRSLSDHSLGTALLGYIWIRLIYN